MKTLVGILGVGLLLGSGIAIAESVDLEGVKCVVAPRAAKADKSAEYKKGEVYFCCGNCQAKFEKDPKAHAKKANMQLVATDQYEQHACPISGRPLNPDTKLKVADAEVTFCCNNCKGKVAAADDDEKLELVFSEKAFEKGEFKPKKKKDDAR